MGLTICNVVLHPSSWINLQFSGLGGMFSIRRWDTPKCYVRLQAINTGSVEMEPDNLGVTHPTEPPIVLSRVFALSVTLGIVYVFGLLQH